jgi:hypothetical protein
VTSLAAMVFAASRHVTKSAVQVMKRHDMALRSYYGAVDDRPEGEADARRRILR